MVRRSHHACIVRWCTNTSGTSNASFYRVPKDDRTEAFLKYARRPELAALPKEKLHEHRICSAHFTENDFSDPAKTRLVWSAVPCVKAPDELPESEVTVQANVAARPLKTKKYVHQCELNPLCSTPPVRGCKKKVFTPQTGRILKKWRTDARRGVGCHPEKCKSGGSPCHWHELRGDMYRHLALLVHGCFQLVMRRRCTGHRARYQGLSAPQSCRGFLPGEPDVMMAPQKTTSGERPPTCRTQKERPRRTDAAKV
ncbi:hypothetical protein HPB50_009331 [Hyalomma asiaticum]|uniref:Uncharacterized protein n=1 Tax=Hyalomma asiaticum TaxID=266040 RepID=A0ACB7S1D6_HYAAI|nr:hypothetical protein HPB50_009331 [Hyalomma asiaticum]